jgi:hypothetical protein
MILENIVNPLSCRGEMWMWRRLARSSIGLLDDPIDRGTGTKKGKFSKQLPSFKKKLLLTYCMFDLN